MTESIAVRFKALRNRAGLTLGALASAMGYRGASSIQRFEQVRPQSPPYIEVAIVQRLEAAVVGLGSPPITTEDVYALASPEWRAARAALSGDFSEIDSLQEGRRIPDVRVTDSGTLVETERWVLPQRISDVFAGEGETSFVIAIHNENQTFFIDRRVAVVSESGRYAVVDATNHQGFRLEAYDAERLAADRRQTVLMSGVIGKVIGVFSLSDNGQG